MGYSRDVGIIEKYLAAVRFNQSHGHVKRGGFACTVGAKQADHLAAFNTQADPIHYFTTPVDLDQFANGQDGH
jgi:hypothetical protein